MSISKKVALSWLSFILLASCASWIFKESIHAHRLDQSLLPFKDVFGRSMPLLTLNAIFKSIFTLFPLSVLYLIFGIALSVGLTLLPQKNILILLIQSFIDTLSSLPGLLIGLAISALGKGSLLSVTGATLVMILPHLVRFFESQILHFKAQTFYASAEALGATPLHLSLRHLFPELFSLSVAIFPFILSRLLYIETTLSFLGIGTVSMTESWGQLINQSREYLLEAPWMIVISGFPLLLTLWSFHLLSHRESS